MTEHGTASSHKASMDLVSQSARIRMGNHTARLVLCLAMCAAVPQGILDASTIAVDFAVTPISGLGAFATGGDLYRYTYFIRGVALGSNQAVDIEFDAAVYSDLSNGVTRAGFDTVLLQPNNPPGAAGVYSIMALTDGLSFFGSFGVDVKYTGAGVPGAQPFFINQYDGNANIVATTAAGVTAARTPEPGTAALGVIGLLIGIGIWTARTHRAGTA